VLKVKINRLLVTADVDLGTEYPIWYKLHVVKVQGILLKKSVQEKLVYPF